jgi:molecular chaperone DnaK
MEALSRSSMKLGEQLYKQQGSEAEAAEPGPQQGRRAGEENVVDADFEEVDEDKKNRSA